MTQNRWTELWRKIAAKGAPLPAYEELVTLNREPHRHYHNLRHITECLAEFDGAQDLAQQPLAVELAIWFHDAIYDTRAHDNEERSAALARRRVTEAGGDAPLGEAVFALIMATKAHDSSWHPDAPLLVDMDLSVFGQADARFQEYEGQIRLEYDWVPEATFAAKRAEILDRFLARARIYATDYFASKYEHQARLNLRESVRRWKRRSHALR